MKREVHSVEPPGMLSERYSEDFLREQLLPLQDWRPIPPASDRESWQQLLAAPLNRQRRNHLVKRAESLLGAPWPALPATLYMDFFRTGNVVNFTAPYSARRKNLAILVLAECFEYKGRFLDEIVNGLWLITEEASWCLPPHKPEKADFLPNNRDCEYPDLNACETAMLLAEETFLLGERLKRLSTALCDRVRREILRRVIAPVETRDNIHWFRMTNNWVSWCCANTLGAAMYTFDDLDRMAGLARKLMKLMDRFLSHYGPDGGCGEGPSYWNMAAGSLLVFLEFLYSRTNGAVDIYSERLIQNMGSYIVHSHLDGPWFANFADASARAFIRRAPTYRYGERVSSGEMKNLALLAARNWQEEAEAVPLDDRERPEDMIRELFWIPDDAEPVKSTRKKSVWLPDLQIMFARQSDVPGEGLVLAAKAGHNGESHNHNDIGQFIIMLDGQPAIIDIGSETYTHKTFGPERYTIWWIRSSAHDVPCVDGYEQLPGKDHCATNVCYADNDGKRSLIMNLENAYPEQAGLSSFKREIVFSSTPTPCVTVADTFRMIDKSPEISFPLYSPATCEEVACGRIRIRCGRRNLLLESTPELKATVETIPVSDKKLKASWGESLTRVTLHYKSKAREGSYMLKFFAEENENRAPYKSKGQG